MSVMSIKKIMYYLQDNTVQDNTVAEIVTLVEELGAGEMCW